MTSVRLEKSIEKKLELISQLEHISKSELIKRALERYFEQYNEPASPFKVGEELFGQYGSGESDRSSDYKNKLKAKLHEKHSH